METGYGNVTSPPPSRISQAAGASPYVWTNTSGREQTVIITSGNVTLTRVSRDGVTYDPLTVLLGAQITLFPGDKLEITWLITAPQLAIY